MFTQMPVIASNRVGTEEFPARPEKTASSITFHGGSFITGPTGEIVAQARCLMQAQRDLLSQGTGHGWLSSGL
jgi:predicted amidohydrolase